MAGHWHTNWHSLLKQVMVHTVSTHSGQGALLTMNHLLTSTPPVDMGPARTVHYPRGTTLHLVQDKLLRHRSEFWAVYIIYIDRKKWLSEGHTFPLATAIVSACQLFGNSSMSFHLTESYYFSGGGGEKGVNILHSVHILHTVTVCSIVDVV